MDDLHIIFEAPEAYSVPSKQQSPSPLATACEYCREKKIKCQIKSSSPICLACSTSNRACRSPNRSTTALLSAFSTVDMTSGRTNDAHCDFTLQMCSKDMAQGSPLFDLSIPSGSEVEWSPSSSRSPTAVPTELSELAKTPQVSDCRSTISQRFADEYSYTDSDISTMSDPSPRLHNHSVDHRLVSSSRPSLSDLIFDPVRPPFPSFEYMQEGMQLFFDNLGSHFPFLHRERVYRSMNDMSLPAALANCIVGLAMRFSIAGGPETSRYLLGEPFIEMAKEIIMPVVHIPSLETLHALILLAWCEYGQAREKDLPVFRQYAVSMALSIGVGTDTLLFGASREEQVDFRSTWWSIVTIDLLVSWATGTSTMLSPENYCPARIPALRPAEFLNTLLHEHLYDLLALRNRLLSTIHSNIVLGHERNHADNFRSILAQLADLRARLPPNLKFSIHNLRNAKRSDYHPIFVFFHFSLRSLIAMAGCQSLSYRSGKECSCHVNTVTEAIVDLMNLFESVESRMILASPFLNLPFILVSQTLFAHFYCETPLGEPGDPLPESAAVALRIYLGALLIHQSMWRNPRGSEAMYERMSSFPR